MGFAPATKKSVESAHADAAPERAGAVVQAACATCSGMPRFMQGAQMAAAADAAPATGSQVVQLAATGVASAGDQLPHGDTIQRSFGRHDVGSVRASVGGDGGAAASQMGARAYAIGDKVAFR